MNLNLIYDIEEYVAQINHDYESKDTTEHSFRGKLQNLLLKMLNEGVKDANKVDVINEPKRKVYGAPDFEFRKNDVAIAFLETKDIGDSDVRGIKKHKEQFDRYKMAVNNIAFTNYLCFVLYENGEDFHDGVEYMDDTGDFEDGVYIHAEGDDTRDAMEQTFIIGGFYDSSVKEATVFAVGDYGNTVCTFVSEVFESEDDAQDMYDELVEDFEEVKDYSGEDAEMDSFEEGGMVYTLINADNIHAIPFRTIKVEIISIS